MKAATFNGVWGDPTYANGFIAGTSGTTSIQLAASQSTTVVEAGRILVVDYSTAGADNNKFRFASSATEGRADLVVLTQATSPVAGSAVFGVHEGVVQVLTSDTIANMALGARVALATAGTVNERGTVRLATSADNVCGTVLAVPASNGSAATPVLCTIKLNGKNASNLLLP